MDATTLQDRIARGMGVAARRIGAPYDAYRPSDPLLPLAPHVNYLRLPASFNAADPAYRRPAPYGRPVWFGVFDCAYTLPGDYLVGDADIYFIAAQQPLLPVQCVLTNQVITLSRPAAPSIAGINPYGGIQAATATAFLANWPASILALSGGGQSELGLPGDGGAPYWSVLLPPLPPAAGIVPRSADLVTDNFGRNFVIASADQTDLGWRFLVKQAST